MKRILLFHLSFLLVSAVPMQNGIAQSYTRWALPAGAAARLGKGEITRTGNISYSPDGTKLAVASSQGVWIYDTRIGTEIRLLTNRGGAATYLAFSPDGRTLASGEYYDTSTLLWDVDTGMLKTSLEGHPMDYKSPIFLEFSSNGRTLVSGSGNAPVRLWDVTTGEYKRLELETDKIDPTTVVTMAFSPDGTILASVGAKDKIYFWDSITGEHEATIFGVGAVGNLAFSPDGETIASASYKWDEVDQQNEYPIKLWDVSTKELRLILEGDLDKANSIKFSPDSKTLAIGSENGEISFWDTTTGRQKLKIEAHEYNVISIDYSPYGGTLASVGEDQLIRFWASATGNHKLIISGHTDGIYSVDFSKDGKMLASGSRLGSIRFWDVEKARLRQTISDLGHGVRLSYSPDGETLASISGWGPQIEGEIKLWNVNTGQQKHELSLGPEPWKETPYSYSSVAFSPDGKAIAAGFLLTPNV